MNKNRLKKALDDMNPEIIDAAAKNWCEKCLEKEAKMKTVNYRKRIVLIAAAAALVIAAVMIPVSVMTNKAPEPTTQPPVVTNTAESKTEKQTTPTDVQPGTPTEVQQTTPTNVDPTKPTDDPITPSDPTIPSDTTTTEQKPGFDERIAVFLDGLQSRGLNSETVDKTVASVSQDTPAPDISPEAIVQTLKDNEIIDGRIEKIERLKVTAPDSDEVFYIVTMEVSLDHVVKGEFSDETFTIVSVCKTNTPYEFVCVDDVYGYIASEKSSGTFILRKTDDLIWTIGSEQICAKDLGDYTIYWNLSHDDYAVYYHNFRVELSEIV